MIKEVEWRRKSFDLRMTLRNLGDNDSHECDVFVQGLGWSALNYKMAFETMQLKYSGTIAGARNVVRYSSGAPLSPLSVQKQCRQGYKVPNVFFTTC